jgi:hypothetical protein
MSDALERCDRVALFSAAYFDRSRYTTEEWAAAVHVPGTAEGRLVPVRVEAAPATVARRSAIWIGWVEKVRPLVVARQPGRRPGAASFTR